MQKCTRSLSNVMKKLAVFDFDHTIVDGNSDTIVRDLVPAGQIPSSLGQLFKTDGWTSYMQGIFELLYKHNIGKSKIIEVVQNIQPVPGMCELIITLTQKLNFDVIIISDSNTYFIDTWLKKFNLQSNVEEVFSNPADFVADLLKIEMFHLQTECQLSTKNLCKGKILEDYIKAQNSKSIYYDFITYVGDGSNDLCPILRLKNDDLACVREKYKCIDLIKSLQVGKPIDNSGKTYKIKAEVLVWKTGFDILSSIENKFV